MKVALNEVGGFRNTMTMVLTGLDIEAKAAFAEQQLFDVLGGRDAFDEVDVRLLRFDVSDAPTNEQACAHLRVTVKDADPRKVGRAFSGGVMEIALAGFAGFHTTTPPSSETAFGVYRPAYVPRSALTHVLVDADGNRHVIPDPPTGAVPPAGIARPRSCRRHPGRRGSRRSGRYSVRGPEIRAATPTSDCGHATTPVTRGRAST